MIDLSGNTFFEGPAGRVEAILKEPHGEVEPRSDCSKRRIPLFGGTMHNKVVFRIAKAFHQTGFAALRFNFRGMVGSQGQHDQGQGEEDDLRAAISFIDQDKYPGAEVWLAGFSFGSAVMFRVACQYGSATHALVAVGAPGARETISSISSLAQSQSYLCRARLMSSGLLPILRDYSRGCLSLKLVQDNRRSRSFLRRPSGSAGTGGQGIHKRVLILECGDLSPLLG